MNEVFASHVTSASFHLTLSKPMIHMLAMICDGYMPNLRIFGHSGVEVGAGRRLEERGLVHAPVKEFPGHYEATEEGRLVYELCKRAGLVNYPEGYKPSTFDPHTRKVTGI